MSLYYRMPMRPKDKILNYIEKNMFITLQEGRQLGVSPSMFSRMAAKEEIYRIEQGVYTNSLDWLTHPLKRFSLACTRYPKAVIGGLSALTYYDLTDAEERQTWIALPVPHTLNNPRYRVIRPRGTAYTLGIQKFTFGKRKVRIYDLEKTVVDAFKYHTAEVAYKALKGYLKRKDKNIHKLCNDARKLRKPLDNIVTALLAEE